VPRTVDVAHNIQITIQPNACAERFRSLIVPAAGSAEQTGKLSVTQVLEIHDVAGVERFRLRDWVGGPVEVDAA
jgi:hypothetical protein